MSESVLLGSFLLTSQSVTDFPRSPVLLVEYNITVLSIYSGFYCWVSAIVPCWTPTGLRGAHKVELVLFWVWSESLNQESSIIMELINF